MALSKHSKVQEIMKSPRAIAILEEYVPRASHDPRIRLAMGLSFEQVAKLVPETFRPEWIDEIDARLQALGEGE